MKNEEGTLTWGELEKLAQKETQVHITFRSQEGEGFTLIQPIEKLGYGRYRINDTIAWPGKSSDLAVGIPAKFRKLSGFYSVHLPKEKKVPIVHSCLLRYSSKAALFLVVDPFEPADPRGKECLALAFSYFGELHVKDTFWAGISLKKALSMENPKARIDALPMFPTILNNVRMTYGLIIDPWERMDLKLARKIRMATAAKMHK